MERSFTGIRSRPRRFRTPEGTMRGPSKILAVFFVLFGTALWGGCGSVDNPSASELTDGRDSGAALYGQTCAACHGELGDSTLAIYSATDIQTSIDSNTGGMGFLNFLDANQVLLIADAIGAVKGVP